MKNMRQIARPASVDEEKDQTDAAATKYKNFNNRKTSGSTVSSDDQNTVGEFINPVYRDSSIKRDDQNNISQKDKEAYDSLNFRSDSKASQQNGHPARTDITKPPGEEIEMGVHNYGYGDNEKARPNSWDKSISTFSPYAVDTPIGGPVESQSNTGLSVQDKRNSISKGSEYSFIGEENPYAAPSIKNPDYDTIPGLEKGRLPPPRQGTRKTNLAYESAVIKHTEVRKTVDKSPKEGYAAEEGSSCCHVIFTILVGLLALIAIVVVFLVVFGVISAKKCKECDVQVPSTDSQTGGQNGNDANKAILAEIEALRNNLTALHKAMANNPKPVNQTGTIILLQNEVSQQKLHVQTLTNELAKQRNLTSSLNQTTQKLKEQFTLNKQQMIKSDETLRIRQTTLFNTVRKLDQTISKNMTRTEAKIGQMNASLANDILQTRSDIVDVLANKISTRNFTKLINDSQNVVDQLYGMINVSRDNIVKLNSSLASNLETLEQDVSKITYKITGNLLTTCKLDNKLLIKITNH
ncbi:uncharacterized protein [Clytia hemisphaerica]|uniref:uncharacterized protein isoform X2 n=1 Tax=Clytia hemisphaerica TaxID=252671 RepID=UPI0034D5A4BE